MVVVKKRSTILPPPKGKHDTKLNRKKLEHAKTEPSIESPIVSIHRENMLSNKTVFINESAIIVELAIDVFRKYDEKTIDLDALIFLVMKNMIINPHNYLFVKSNVKTHILNYFDFQQGDRLMPKDIAVRRMIIRYDP